MDATEISVTDFYGMARLALDAATEADGAIRGRCVDLSGLSEFADRLDAAWDGADPVEVDHVLATMPDRKALRTMDELAVSVADVTAMLRRAAMGESGDLGPARDYLLGFHRETLCREADAFRPLGLVA